MTDDKFVEILAELAPEIEGWGLAEFDRRFEEDYPKPWMPDSSCHEYMVACSEAAEARGRVIWWQSRSEGGAWSSPLRDQGFQWSHIRAWKSLREDALREFKRDEWPVMWARKRLEAAKS